MGKRSKRSTVGICDLDPGMERAREIYDSIGEDVSVVNRRGDSLARIVPEAAYEPDPANLAVKVAGDVFFEQRHRFVYIASLGHRFHVEDNGRNFLVLPPIDFPGNVSPASLGAWWALGRQVRQWR